MSKTQVFSEKMGLEAGWNCHISLLNDEISLNEGLGSGPGSYIQGRRSAESASQDHLDLQGNTERKLSEEVMACRSQSAPCVIAVDEVQQVKFSMQVPEEIGSSENGNNPGDKVPPGVRRPSNKSLGSTAKSKSTIHSRLDKSEHEDEEEEERAREGSRLLSSSTSSLTSTSSSTTDGELGHQSDSRYTSSYVTEYTDDSLTGALDNRVSESGETICVLNLLGLCILFWMIELFPSLPSKTKQKTQHDGHAFCFSAARLW